MGPNAEDLVRERLRVADTAGKGDAIFGFDRLSLAQMGHRYLMTERNLDDDDMKTNGPTEEGEDRDTGGSTEGRDTGDLPTERGEDRDAGGEGNQDTGDEA